jgi:hypothetical protein
MIGKSMKGFCRLSSTEKAGNVGIDETPPSQGIRAPTGRSPLETR